MDALNLSTAVLKWAAENIGETLESLAQAIAVRPGNRERIVRGELTVAQAEKIAKRTKVPFGLLFLDKPPQLRQPQIPDLRQTENPAPLSRDFFDVLADVLDKQEWYTRYLRINGAVPLPLVGKYNFSNRPSPITIANDIRTGIGLNDDVRRASPTPEDYFSKLSARVEGAGVLVMKSGIVKSNTHRPLSEREFRGFALVDKFAPVIFINGKDAWVAAVFTLMHELAHVLLGESGVSDVVGAHRGLERLCNRVAAEVLVPQQAFKQVWLAAPDVDAAARHFRVSRFVVAIRAVQLELMTPAAFNNLSSTLRSGRQNGEGGGNGLLTIPVRNSKRLTRALVASAAGGQTLIRDAANLLNVRPATVMSLSRRESVTTPTGSASENRGQ